MTTLHEYQLRLEGLDRKRRFEWEQSRWKVWQLLSPHYKRGRAPQTPQSFCRFPWNNIDSTKEALERSKVSAEEAAALNALFNNQQTQENG